ncbi:MAG: hypothetical protein O2943_07360 [Actinomycetota bacterium]|nr:hypothetical protein [Actinomycetota bacterium]
MFALIHRPTSALLALILLASAGVIAAPSFAAIGSGAPIAGAVASIDKAPALPGIAQVTSSGTGKPATPRSVLAAAALGTGVFTIFSGVGTPRARTVVTLPVAGGTPLLADWDGDGLATPGRYEAGQWFSSSNILSNSSWEAKGTWGGQPGDLPVTGDLNGDGKADIGVFRGGQWLWQIIGGATVDERFGEPGDLPVVGDWDGDGRDDVGVFRAGSWILRFLNVKQAPKVSKGVVVTMVPEANAAVLTFPFGLSTDTPVVGDWNADGIDTPGVVRDRAQWILSSGPAKLKKSMTVSIPVAADQTPLVGTQATLPGHCPTATATSEKSAYKIARRVVAPARIKGTLKIDGMAEIKATVKDGLRYVIVNDLTKRLKGLSVMPYYDALNRYPIDEESIRRVANSAQAAAIMATTSDWKNVNGISRSELVSYARWHIRTVTCQHQVNSPGGWGNTFQSALWATVAGQAGWLLWPELSTQERAYIASMVAAEADNSVARGPFYFRNRAGVELTPGDSRADEVSWDLMAPALALAMMPKDPRAPTWRATLVALSIAAFARPSDLTSNGIYNGVILRNSLPGTNANEDGTITNHGKVNPDYTQNVQHLWWAASLLRNAKQRVPAAVFLNADIVYRALAVVNFPSPPYAAPGGTVYQPLGQIYYPMGVSWGVRRPATFTGVDGFANVYAAPDAKAGEFLAAHARDTRALQLRWTDGHIYGPGLREETYRLGKEEYALSQMALAWWSGAIKSSTQLSVMRDLVPGVNLESRVPVPQ